MSASSTLTFTTSNWNTEQTVTVKASRRPDAADDDVTLTHTASGGDYRDVTKDLPVRVEDDESPHLALSKESISPVEGSPSGESYTVRLGSQPTATATVTISGHDGTDLTLSTTTLTFTTSNWNTAREVTVTAAQDPDAADDPTTLTHTATGGDYGDVDRDLPVTVTDDETASIVLSATELEPVEGDSSGRSYSVRLSHVPTATTTVTVRGHAGTDLSLDRTSLTFTSSNWNTAQTVTVTASHDDDAVTDRVTLTHTAAGEEYEGLTKALEVTVIEDEVTGVTVAPSAISVVAGGGNTYTVRLGSQPAGDVTVTISGHEGSDLALSGTTDVHPFQLDVAQTVTVSAGGSAASSRRDALAHRGQLRRLPLRRPHGDTSA